MNTHLVALLFFVVTVAIYGVSKGLYQRRRRLWLSPVVVTPIALIILVKLTHTPFSVYFEDTRWLSWLLGPATIAFAYPIYTQRALLRRYPVTLFVGVCAGLGLGLFSSWLLGRLFGLPSELAHSLLPRSVSTPFALAAAGAFGGDKNLTVICVMVTGIFGILIGDTFLGWLGLRSSVSKGAALGASAHGFGTSKAYEIGDQEGAVASLVMVFTGVSMVLLAPLFARWVG